MNIECDYILGRHVSTTIKDLNLSFDVGALNNTNISSSTVCISNKLPESISGLISHATMRQRCGLTAPTYIMPDKLIFTFVSMLEEYGEPVPVKYIGISQIKNGYDIKQYIIKAIENQNNVSYILYNNDQNILAYTGCINSQYIFDKHFTETNTLIIDSDVNTIAENIELFNCTYIILQNVPKNKTELIQNLMEYDYDSLIER